MMEALKCLIVACYATYGLAQATTPTPTTTPDVTLNPEEMQSADNAFIFEIAYAIQITEQQPQPQANPPNNNNNNNNDGNDDNDNDNGANSNDVYPPLRKRRALGDLDLVGGPSGFRSFRGSGVYYRRPARIGGFPYYYDFPGYGATRGGYYSVNNRGGEWSFVQFYNSFRPMKAVLTADNTYVRDYVRVGSFNDCLGDFWRLGLTGVKAITGDSLHNDYGLVGGVRVASARRTVAVASETTTAVGYVGVMRNFPYVVLAVRSGCQLDGFAGFHDCLVFTGATYPYTNTVRRFVYVNRRSVALTSSVSGYSHPVPAIRGLRSFRSLVQG